MNTQEKEIASTVIFADLINQHLISGLCSMGLDALDYSLDLPRSAMMLLGYTKEQRTDELYEAYRLASEHYVSAGKPSFPLLKIAAVRLVDDLEKWKKAAKTGAQAMIEPEKGKKSLLTND